MQFSTPNKTRNETRGIIEKFRAGRLVPSMVVPFRQNEGGVINQRIFIELEPLAGRLLTPPTSEIYVVGVPVQAMYALSNPNDPHAHLTDVVRDRLKANSVLFPLEPDNEIAQRCAVNPKSINGQKLVSSAIRLGHNAAVNFLRLSKYWKATKVPASNLAVTPALLGSTVLQRLNAVLDPDDRINGAVPLQFPSVTLPVKGITRSGSQSSGNSSAMIAAHQQRTDIFGSNSILSISMNGNTANLTAELDSLIAGNLSLLDFANAEFQDKVARHMDKILRENPIEGPELVAAWARGLQMETNQPVLLARRSVVMSPDIIGATDSVGVEQDIQRSDMALSMSITIPVPRSELGMLVYTFVVLKPDETLDLMPHPILTEPWGAENMIEETMALDPVPVLGRELSSDISLANETQVYMYTGHNQLKRSYSQYGLSRRLNPNTVENKTAIWQYRVPLSVTPDSILYPPTLSQYPFSNQLDEIATISIQSNAIIQTPMIFGPTPVEALPQELSQIIEEGQ